MDQALRRPNIIDRHYISEKVSVARWKPEGVDKSSEYLVTGSWDNAGDNRLSIRWLGDGRRNGGALNDAEEECPMTTAASGGDAPVVIDSRIMADEADVTEIKFLDTDTFVYSTTEGNVYLMNVGLRSDGSGIGGGVRLLEVCRWEGLHELKTGASASCSAMDVIGPHQVVTGGEDGRLALLSASEHSDRGPVAVFDSQNSAAITAVCFVRHNEIVAGNSRGLLKVWDVRSPSSDDGGGGGGCRPSAVFPMSKEGAVWVTALASFPAQKHLLVGGGDNGTVTVWDLRKSTTPLLLFNAHQMSVNQVHFHHNRPSNLFTCSETGEIWQWHNFDSIVRQAPEDLQRSRRTEEVVTSSAGGGGGGLGGGQLTLNTDSFTTAKPEVESLLGPKSFPTNTVDANQDSLLAASDSESIIIIRPLVLR